MIDSLIYFLMNSGIIIASVGLVSFILGMILAYIWKPKRHKITRIKRNKLQKKLALLRKKHRISEAEHKNELKQIHNEHKHLFEVSKKFFSSSIKSGKITKDRKYGYIYKIKPDSQDNLSEIIGIKDAIHKQLNKFGIYTFRQIALWDKKTMKRFAEKLSDFKDRMLWDDWMGQARKLHKEKYGEGV